MAQRHLSIYLWIFVTESFFLKIECNCAFHADVSSMAILLHLKKYVYYHFILVIIKVHTIYFLSMSVSLWEPEFTNQNDGFENLKVRRFLYE